MAMHEEAFDYRDGDTTCKGRLVLPEGEDRRAGVVVFPDIMGLGDHPLGRARRLAKELGYVALVADVYGEGDFPGFPEALEVVAAWLSRPQDLARRAAAALTALGDHPRCDGTVGAIGFCFGGATVLALARSGHPSLRAGVAFHGVLATPEPAGPGAIGARLLVCHGADDPFAGEAALMGRGGAVASQTLEAFLAEMSHAGADCQVIAYAGVVHAFTIPHAGDLGTEGARYDARADTRSWSAMAAFLEETL
jgi:dienelactone hydrolase